MATVKKTVRETPEFITVSQAVPTEGMPRGYDPEMLYVECARCGSPVIWEPGRATALMQAAGIDPLELDPSCMLATDGCPLCSRRGQFRVQVLRLTAAPVHMRPRNQGSA